MRFPLSKKSSSTGKSEPWKSAGQKKAMIVYECMKGKMPVVGNMIIRYEYSKPIKEAEILDIMKRLEAIIDESVVILNIIPLASED